MRFRRTIGAAAFHSDTLLRNLRPRDVLKQTSVLLQYSNAQLLSLTTTRAKYKADNKDTEKGVALLPGRCVYIDFSALYISQNLISRSTVPTGHARRSAAIRIDVANARPTGSSGYVIFWLAGETT